MNPEYECEEALMVNRGLQVYRSTGLQGRLNTDPKYTRSHNVYTTIHDIKPSHHPLTCNHKNSPMTPPASYSSSSTSVRLQADTTGDILIYDIGSSDASAQDANSLKKRRTGGIRTTLYIM
jgi:hypothetical protein